MNTQKRTVTLPASVMLREAEGSPNGTLEGYALKFGVRSVPLELGGVTCYEILEPGCVTREMLSQQRIYFTMHHNREMILGRWDRGKGSLHLEADETGLHIECEIPHTYIGDHAREMVSRGDLTEMSFAYWTDETDKTAVFYEKTDERTADGSPVYLRHVTRIDYMFDVTIAATPAFTDTEISAREAQLRELCENEEPQEPAHEEEEQTDATPAADEDVQEAEPSDAPAEVEEKQTRCGSHVISKTKKIVNSIIFGDY